MNGKIGFLLLLGILGSITEAAPVVVPMGKMAGGELSAVLPNPESLQFLLIAQGASIIVFLVKTLWQMFHKKSNENEAALNDLKVAVQGIQAELKTLAKLPDEKEIMERLEKQLEYMVYKQVRELEKRQ